MIMDRVPGIVFTECFETKSENAGVPFSSTLPVNTHQIPLQASSYRMIVPTMTPQTHYLRSTFERIKHDRYSTILWFPKVTDGFVATSSKIMVPEGLVI